MAWNVAKSWLNAIHSYGLVTEQKRGAYKYFVDLADRMEVANVRTVYVDEVCSLSFWSTLFVYLDSQ